VTAFFSLPLYIYFKREELTIRSKLAFMSHKEIEKAVGRIQLTQDFMRIPYNKGAVGRLQMAINDKLAEKDED
jgi:hypothetical protein